MTVRDEVSTNSVAVEAGSLLAELERANCDRSLRADFNRGSRMTPPGLVAPPGPKKTRPP